MILAPVLTQRGLLVANLICLASMMIWAAGLPAADLILPHMPPLALTAARATLAAMVLVPIWWALEGTAELRRANWLRGAWVGFVALGLASVFVIIALELTDTVTVAIVTAVMPVAGIALESVADRRPLTRAAILGLVLSLVGGLVALSGGVKALDLGVGALAALASVLAYTWGSRETVRAFPSLTPLGRAAITVAGAAAVMLVAAVADGLIRGHWPDWGAIGPREFTGLAIFGIGSMAISQLLWIISVGRIGIGAASLHMNAVPFYVMLIVFALGGAWNWWQTAGAVIVVVGALVAQGLYPAQGGVMQTLAQSPTDPAFVQDPYPFYERARSTGPFFRWQEYDLICTGDAAAVGAIFRDRRFGREVPAERAPVIPDHLRPFYAVEAHSMLELEPPRHTRLRGLVLRAFTSRRIAALAPEIAALSYHLIDGFPAGPFDLLAEFGQRLPVIIIARLLGIPEERAPDLLRWSNAMVGMYMAGRTRAREDAAIAATEAFVAFLTGYIAERRAHPADDLITHLIAVEEAGERLSTDELIATCILLLNAGHEATVHTIGNGVKALLETATPASVLAPDAVEATVEEILRFDPALHMFTRWAYEDVTVAGHAFRRGDQVGLLLGAANRDPSLWEAPDRFDPTRPIRPHASFGAGLHFCVGAPLARLELQIALPILFQRVPTLRLAAPPSYANVYHFHGLSQLMVTA